MPSSSLDTFSTSATETGVAIVAGAVIAVLCIHQLLAFVTNLVFRAKLARASDKLHYSASATSVDYTTFGSHDKAARDENPPPSQSSRQYYDPSSSPPRFKVVAWDSPRDGSP